MAQHCCCLYNNCSFNQINQAKDGENISRKISFRHSSNTSSWAPPHLLRSICSNLLSRLCRCTLGIIPRPTYHSHMQQSAPIGRFILLSQPNAVDTALSWKKFETKFEFEIFFLFVKIYFKKIIWTDGWVLKLFREMAIKWKALKKERNWLRCMSCFNINKHKREKTVKFDQLCFNWFQF